MSPPSVTVGVFGVEDLDLESVRRRRSRASSRPSSSSACSPCIDPMACHVLARTAATSPSLSTTLATPSRFSYARFSALLHRLLSFSSACCVSAMANSPRRMRKKSRSNCKISRTLEGGSSRCSVVRDKNCRISVIVLENVAESRGCSSPESCVSCVNR